MPKDLISIIVPTCAQDPSENLIPCLESIKKHTDIEKIEVIVVSNGTSEKTEKYLNSLKSPFRSILYKNKLGFPFAINEGIKASQGEFIVFLNDDIVLLDQEKNKWIEHLIKPFWDNPRAGISGPYKSNFKQLNKDFIVFFCAMTRRSILDKVGWLDEGFGLGGAEDIDFCIRVQNHGYEIIQVPHDKVDVDGNFAYGSFPLYHKMGATAKTITEWEDSFAGNINRVIKKHFADGEEARNFNHIVNIIIPTYQRHDRLKKVLGDISIQTYRNIRACICSDGYDERVKNIVNEFEKKSNDIIFSYWFMEEHKGKWGAPSRRKILERIEPYGFVCFVDDDNEISPKYVEKLYSKMSEEMGMTYCLVVIENLGNIIVPKGDVSNSFALGEIDSLNVMVRTSVAKKLREHWDGDDYNHDFLFIDACSKAVDSRFVPEVLARHKDPNGSDVFFIDKHGKSTNDQNIKLTSGSLDNNKTMKLNIGSGEDVMDGFINYDLHAQRADVRGDAKVLPFKNNSISEIVSLHLIEHLDFHAGLVFLKEAYRILEPGGAFYIETPDLRALCEKVISVSEEEIFNLYPQFFGFPYQAGQSHDFLYTEVQLGWRLESVGFINISREPAIRYINTMDTCMRLVCEKRK